MSPDAKTAAYSALVAEAEAAVAPVKDPELRRVAFEKILATLLDKNALTKSPRKESKGRSKGGGKRISGRRATKSRKGPKTYVEELVDDGFFKKQRTIANVKAELANRGHHIPITSLSGPLQSLTQDRRLRRQKTSGDDEGTRNTYAYSNW